MSKTPKEHRIPGILSNLHVLAGGTALSFSGEIVNLLISFGYGILIARTLGAAGYGVFFLGLSIFNFLALFSHTAIEDGLMRFLGFYVQADDMGKAKGVIGFGLIVSLVLGLIFGGLCFFCAELLATRVFGKPELAVVLRCLGLGMPLFSLMSMTVASIRGFKIVKHYILVRRFLFPLMTVAFAGLALVKGCGLRGLSLSYLVALGAASIAGSLLLRRFMRRSPERICRPELDRVSSFFGAAFLVSVLTFLIAWCDLMVVGVFCSRDQVGIYYAAKKVPGIILLFLFSLNVIFVPMVSHFHSNDERSALSHVYKSTTRWMLIASTPVFLAILAVSRPFLSLYGPAFLEGQWILILIAVAFFINCVLGANDYLLLMTDHQRYMVVNVIVVTLLAVPLYIFAASRFGAVGAAAAMLSITVVSKLVLLIEGYLLLHLHPFDKHYAKVAILAALTAALSYLLQYVVPAEPALLLPALRVGLPLVVFLAAIPRIGLDGHEKEMIMGVLQRANGWVRKDDPAKVEPGETDAG